VQHLVFLAEVSGLKPTYVLIIGVSIIYRYGVFWVNIFARKSTSFHSPAVKTKSTKDPWARLPRQWRLLRVLMMSGGPASVKIYEMLSQFCPGKCHLIRVSLSF